MGNHLLIVSFPEVREILDEDFLFEFTDFAAGEPDGLGELLVASARVVLDDVVVVLENTGLCGPGVHGFNS